MINNMAIPATVKNKKFAIRLPKFFNLVRIFSFVNISIFILFIHYFPEYFAYILDRKILIIILLSLTFWDIIFYAAISPFASRKIVLYANNISWALFMFGVVYVSGGVYSPLIIILAFPIITTAFDLEAKASRIIGGLTAAMFTAQIFLDGRFPHTKSYFSVGFTELLLIGIATHYTYAIIKETLRQKYEKEEAARKYSDLLEADEAKSEFITIASHQLRTPLTELKWLINDGDRQSIIKAKNSVDKIMKVADSILLASEQTKDEFKYKPVMSDLIIILKETIDDLKESASKRNTAIHFEDYPEKIIILIDQQRMRLALANIIDNAVRYSPNGDIHISVKENTEIIVSIADNGIGIPEDQQKRIFTKLFRARNAISIEPNETGLGLYITKSIIEKHGGRIWFESKEGEGTTFFIALPISG